MILWFNTDKNSFRPIFLHKLRRNVHNVGDSPQQPLAVVVVDYHQNCGYTVGMFGEIANESNCEGTRVESSSDGV